MTDVCCSEFWRLASSGSRHPQIYCLVMVYLHTSTSFLLYPDMLKGTRWFHKGIDLNLGNSALTIQSFPQSPPPILLHERVSTVGSVLGLRSREKTNNS